MFRYFRTAIFGLGLLLSVIGQNVGQAYAGEVSADQFKTAVMGNTLDRKFFSNRSGRDVEYMFHFIDEKELLFSSAQSAPTQKQDWSFTSDGKFCYEHTYRSHRRLCYEILRIDESSLVWKNGAGKEEKILLLKGKHTAK